MTWLRRGATTRLGASEIKESLREFARSIGNLSYVENVIHDFRTVETGPGGERTRRRDPVR